MPGTNTANDSGKIGEKEFKDKLESRNLSDKYNDKRNIHIDGFHLKPDNHTFWTDIQGNEVHIDFESRWQIGSGTAFEKNSKYTEHVIAGLRKFVVVLTNDDNLWADSFIKLRNLNPNIPVMVVFQSHWDELLDKIEDARERRLTLEQFSEIILKYRQLFSTPNPIIVKQKKLQEAIKKQQKKLEEAIKKQ